MKITILILTGIAAGLVSGMLGIGGGVIIIPALVYFLGFTQQMAQGTSLAALIPPIGLLAAYRYWKYGNVNIKFALIIAGLFFISAYFGAGLVQKMPELMLRRIFGVFLLIVSVKMILGI